MITKLSFRKIFIFIAPLFCYLQVTSQQWTWVKGDNIGNTYGFYTVPYNAFGANNPGARNGAATWTDNSGLLWLFGGDGYAASSTGRLNDLWSYNASTNEWTWVAGSNVSNQAGIYGTKGVTSSTNCPGARGYCVSWKDASGNFWLFGGEGRDVNGSFGNLNDLWKFDVSTLSWTWVSGSNVVNQYGVYGTQGLAAASNGPGGRRISQGWADNSGNLWLFGGYGQASSGGEYSMNDLWKYNIASGQWTWMSGDVNVFQASNYGTLGTPAITNVPGARYGSTTWIDASGNLWLCNGIGRDAVNESYMSDIWKYNPSTGMWTWMDGSSTVNEAFAGVQGISSSTATPGARYISSSWTDASGNLYLFGGYGINGYCGDLWRYNISTGIWTWLRGNTGMKPNFGTKGVTSSITDVGIRYYAPSWKDNSNNFWLFGGVGYDYYNTLSNTNSLWKTSVPVSVPTASFSFNQSANVCQGTRVALIDQSSNNPASYNYYVDGSLFSYDPNAVLTNSNSPALASGTHTVSLVASNAAGSGSMFTRTINVSSLSATTITRTPGGTYNLFVGSGQTNVSDWSPWVYTFTDPLPSGVTITRVDMTYNGVDQGWGGSGATATFYLSDEYVSSAVYSHYSTPFSTSLVNTFRRYNYGGTNTIKMYFVGYPGWQGFVSNLNVTFYYERYDVKVCAGSSTSLTAAGGFVRAWSGGIVEGIPFTPTASAIYTVTSTELNGCQNTNTISVTVDSPTISIYPGQICSGKSFTIVPTGASTYTYIGGLSVVSPTTNTNYSVTGTSSLGCPASNTAVVTVSVNSSPSISVNSGNLCIGSIFTINPSGALTYTLSAPSSTVSPTTLTAYSVTGTSSKGCLSSNVAVSTVSVLNLPVISASSGSICPGKTFTITPAGASTYTYSSGTNTVSPSVLTNYSVTGTDTYGCISAAPAVLSVDIYSTPTIAATSGTICAGNSYSIGVSGAISYTYSGGSALVSPASTTTYSVSGTNSFGCVSLAPAIASVTVFALPVVTANSGTICSGSSFTITPGGALNYTFLTGATVVTPSTSTSYSIIGNDALGCMSAAPALANVVVNALPVLNITGPNAVCSGSAITINVSGANTYSWNTGSNSTGITVNPTVQTTYTVAGTNTLTGCIGSTSRIITVGNLPVITVNSGNVCAGSVYTIQPSGAASYTVSTGSGTTSLLVSPLVNTSYFVSGTSSLGCVSTTSAVCNVIVNAAPVINVNSGAVCAGNVFSMTPTGASTYTYSNGSSTVIPAANASYTVTGTSVQGCVSTVPAVAHVTVNSLPFITATNGTVCSGSNFSLVPSGAATYTFMTSSGPSSSWVSPSANTNYSITGTSAAGCLSSNTAIMTLSVIALPSISINSGTVCSGSVFTLAPSGASTYTFSSGVATVIPLGNTSYSVTGTSSAGCTSSAAAVANVSLIAVPVVSVNSGVICSGTVFTLTPTGAVSYTYSSGSNTVAPSSNTFFTVVGSNAQGCVSPNAAVANLVVNSSPTLSILGNPVICDGESANLLATGANTYTWNGSVTGPIQNFSPLSTSIYTVMGTGVGNCVGSTTVLITVNPLPVLSLNAGTVCPGTSFTFIPSGALTYTFFNGSNVVTPFSTTSYSVMGTDGNGCISAVPAVSTITVTNNVTLTVSGNTMVCAGSSASLTASGAGTYTWSTGESTNVIVAAPSTSSVYTVVGSMGTCRDTAYISVQVNSLPILNVNSSSTLLCVGETASLTGSGANSYAWNSGETTAVIVISPTITTSYTISGTDLNGCEVEISFTQNVNQCLGLANTSLQELSLVTVYPNPNAGEFVVEAPKALNMVISDALGQVVLRTMLQEGRNKVVLNDQAKGIYFVELRNLSQIAILKVIKQ